MQATRWASAAGAVIAADAYRHATPLPWVVIPPPAPPLLLPPAAPARGHPRTGPRGGARAGVVAPVRASTLVRCEEEELRGEGGRPSWRPRRSENRDSPKKRLIQHTDFLYRCTCAGQLEDVYTLERELGTGAFGTVYLARHKLNGHCRAVKKLAKDPGDPEQMADLMAEVHAMMSLDHPNVAHLVRYYDTAESLFLVFENCEGPDLFNRIVDDLTFNPSHTMTERDAAAALRQMLKALKCCHDKYIGHFDVKPENFIYSSKDLTSLKMIDLGLSSGFKRGAEKAKGTADYMAPEMWGGKLGPEADVWSCGVVLFVMLTGCSFAPQGTGEGEVKRYVRDRFWIKQRVRWACKEFGLSPDAQDLLTRMLRHDRHQRPTVREALMHPFLRVPGSHGPPAVEDPQAQDVLATLSERICAFAAEPLLVRAALLLMAHIRGYQMEAMRPQRLAFAALDIDEVGELSIEAVEQHYLQSGGDREGLEAAFDGVDINDNGYINYLEFLAATLPHSLRSQELLCRTVFDMLDPSLDGYIDADDLSRTFGHGSDAQGICSDALAEICGPECLLSWEHFLRLMRTDVTDSSKIT
mmetsp:Transcript_95399/g.270034  ORF Transcript_95399/g.270034 Transcript_95399/m.270034 type:complete len:583 (-) Transcript_95399:63-1811(-)|eukprot:CAMPEP_0179220594 /NCGR_PEP_ID=MMETSP0797-20121207/5712_1 /TAXON_ID=47934 /ORGANISM="Dinophysis acuminata, Strain DAEP01" /LENGTH=582 /DNA_ID=CAMNT_0020927263 /DNA_START=19 /DNA_END=1767 /DNA_ORIENTATION=-